MAKTTCTSTLRRLRPRSGSTSGEGKRDSPVQEDYEEGEQRAPSISVAQQSEARSSTEGYQVDRDT